MRTGSARCDGEAFEGICACIQYVLSLIPRDVFQFGRSEVDPARKLVSELRRPTKPRIRPDLTIPPIIDKSPPLRGHRRLAGVDTNIHPLGAQ